MPIIYNITFIVDKPDADNAVKYLCSVLVPTLMQHSLASNPRLCRVVTDQTQALSYALEFTLPSSEQAEVWFTTLLQPALATITELWGESMLFFHTQLIPTPLPITCLPPTTE